MAQVRVTRSLRAVGLQARAASRVLASPRAGLSWAAPRASPPTPTLAFSSRLFSNTRFLADESAKPEDDVKPAETAIPDTEPEHDGTFPSLKGHIDPAILSAIANDLKLEKMTSVQALATSLLSPRRPDALVQAGTGAGKKLAFLLPALQRCIEMNNKKGAVSAVIIAPTRELATQIAELAQVLMKDVPEHRVEVLMGSNNKAKEQRRILDKADILVATPGRLLEHMKNDMVNKIFKNVQTIVLDEADRLLDMGFRKSLTEIVESIPTGDSTIQGLVCSATVSPNVKELAGVVCRRGDYKTISTISAGEPQINERVKQEIVEVPNFNSIAPALVGSVKEEAAREGSSFKAIVFAPTSQQVDYYERVLSSIPGLPPVSALHGRKTPARRTKATDEFRSAENAILVATDIVARGVDFPGVSTVFQAGVPPGKESYIHRLGRLAHTEAAGRAVLIAADAEKSGISEKLGGVKLTPRGANPEGDDAISKVNFQMKFKQLEEMYRSWVAYYCKSLNSLKWNQEELVKNANTFVTALGARRTPTMTEKNARKMGLRTDTPGLVMQDSKPQA